MYISNSLGVFVAVVVGVVVVVTAEFVPAMRINLEFRVSNGIPI